MDMLYNPSLVLSSSDVWTSTPGAGTESQWVI